MKRKLSAEQLADSGQDQSPAKHLKSDSITPFHETIRSCFRPDLFLSTTLDAYIKVYKSSQPFPHAVIPSLIDPPLLKSVREEITTHISFTLKETDIYRIHQSGDLANLSNLDSDSLSHLPSLLKLRDALYSDDFRFYLSTITGAGKLSGKKTDMAVNVYTPGSYLLCHDDVIGSRRVSYILYLTDPDPSKAWQAEWGGGLRLYPTETKINEKGEEVKVPLSEHTVTIPPSFGQLSFFAVRPGESFHDVEEVYYPAPESKEPEGSRIRMAISGWYHIPQEGEDGYDEGAEEAQKDKSTLAQLEAGADEFDEPKIHFEHFDEARRVMASDGKHQELDPGELTDSHEDILTEQDLTFLLQYIAPSYLTPDMTEQLSDSFAENSFLQLDKFLRESFATKLKTYLQQQESPTHTNGHTNGQSDHEHWALARPPHKHRFLFLEPPPQSTPNPFPIAQLTTDLLRSHAFKKWLALITGTNPTSLPRQAIVARRFRSGHDYALASSYQGEEPRLEFTLGLTPGWDKQAVEDRRNTSGTNGHTTHRDGSLKIDTSAPIDFGGEEVYMAGDDADEDDDAHSVSVPLPQTGGKAAGTSAINNRSKTADPAVYRTGEEDEDDDNILFTDSPSWNRLAVVLRDKGTLRFVKFVSRAASGDRWDVKGEVEVGAGAFGEGDESGDGAEEEEGEPNEAGEEMDDEEEEEAEQAEEEDDEDDGDDGDSEYEGI